MKHIAVSTTVVALIAAVVMPSTARVEPDGPQRLRGLGGRTFMVQVEVTAIDGPWPFPSQVGDTFPNCYGFDAAGTWIDPGIPIPGTWRQHRNGASTDYTATIEVPGLALLVQRGHIGPEGGGGVLQLDAVTVLTLQTPAGPASGTFRSVGNEAECDLTPPG